MPRVMSSAMQAAFAGSVLRPQMLCTINFRSGPVNVWSGMVPLTWNGVTFTGLGDLGSVQTIEESSAVQAQPVSLGLSGIPATTVGDVLNEIEIFAPMSLYLALFDDTGALIPDPIQIYAGLVDQPKLIDDPASPKVTIACQNIFVDLNRNVARRYTQQDQEWDISTVLASLGLPASTSDTGFRFVPGLQEENTFWGRMPSSSNNV